MPGKENKADWPSRNALEEEEHSKKRGKDEREKFIIKQIKLQISPKFNISWSEIRENTAKDQTLQKIISAIENNSWHKIWKMADIRPYRSFHQQLSVVGGVLLNGKKPVVPATLRPQLLKSGHTIIPPTSMRKGIATQHHLCGHQGISKSSALVNAFTKQSYTSVKDFFLREKK